MTKSIILWLFTNALDGYDVLEHLNVQKGGGDDEQVDDMD